MTDSRISVAMATCNGEPYIAEQLQSIANQSLHPAELVACDDCSSDATVAIIREFAASAPFPVRIETNATRLGYARNFRKAAGLCEGDLIAFADQDDWWEREKLEATAEAFHSPDVLLVYHNATVVDGHRNPIKPLYNAAQEAAALQIPPLAPWHHSYGLVQAFRSELRRFDHLWDLSRHIYDPVDILSHDQWYFFLAQVLGKVRFLDRSLLQYRQHGSNTVGAKEKRPSAGARMTERIVHYGRQDERHAIAARARAAVVEAVATTEAGERHRLEAIAHHYSMLADKLDRRARIYTLPSLSRRLGQLAESIAWGDYANWPWGFDPRSVVRDLWSGVVLARYDEPGLFQPATSGGSKLQNADFVR